MHLEMYSVCVCVCVCVCVAVCAFLCVIGSHTWQEDCSDCGFLCGKDQGFVLKGYAWHTIHNFTNVEKVRAHLKIVEDTVNCFGSKTLKENPFILLCIVHQA